MRFKVNFKGECVDVKISKSGKAYSVINDTDNMQYINLFNVDALTIGQPYNITGIITTSDKGGFLNVEKVEVIK